MSDLTTPQGTSEADILKRISAARGTSEPEQPAPTETQEAVDVSSEETPAEPEQPEQQDESGQLGETEEPESQEEAVQPESDDGEDLYVEYNGREINLKDIAEWEQGHLRQSDYTRKTQELSDQRKAFESEREEFRNGQSKLGELTATLEAMIQEDTLTPEQLAEMREYEPEDYIKHQEKMQKRQELLANAKQVSTPASDVDEAAERDKLWSANPHWIKDGQQTQAFADDLTLMKQYAVSQGFSDAELSGFKTARDFQILIDAAKYQKMSKSNAAVEKKVRKAPVSTKPKQTAKAPAIETKIKEVKARLKRTGANADFQELRRLQRQLKG